jgi:hypothetical protein
MSIIAKTELDTATTLLKSFSASIETKFLTIGTKLGRVVELLEKIIADFDSLAIELHGDLLSSATQDLTNAATQVGGLGQALTLQRSINDRLNQSIPRVDADLSRIHQTVDTVGILAMNGKIAAASIGASGDGFSSEDFLVFAREIDRLVTLARSSLGDFRKDLAQLQQELYLENESQKEFEQNQNEALRNIPKWLSESVASAASHGQQAAATSLTVKERSDHVRRQLGSAIMSLQIGDITRQRIEHVEHALEAVGALIDGRGKHSDQIWWQSLSTDQQENGAAEIYRLQAAQLEQTADDFDSEAREIIAALKGMALDAREILRLSGEAFGAADHLATSPLGALEENVDRALGLLRRFKSAQGAADAMAVSVRDAVNRSTRHLDTVKSLEIDLRLLGLNMTFRCDRLGVAGRALNVVAQELRGCADQTTEDADAVMKGLDQVTTIAGEFSARTGVSRDNDLDSVEKIMTRSVDVFRTAGQSIADTLSRLRRDGEEVATVLQRTAEGITFREEIAAQLRQLSAQFSVAAKSIGLRSIDPSFKQRILSLIDGRYTMASERAIHARIAASHAAASAEGAPSTAPSDSLEDILF